MRKTWLIKIRLFDDDDFRLPLVAVGGHDIKMINRACVSTVGSVIVYNWDDL